MIVVLTADPALQNWWTNLWNRPVFREITVLGESIMLVHPGKRPDWDKLSQKLGRYSSRLLVGEGIELPKERPWKRMDNSKMKEQILCNTLCSFSDSLSWVGLYDPEGKLCVTAWELAQCYPRVTVWCRFRERYQSLCGDLMEQLGAAVELTSDWEGLMGCPLIGAMEAPAFRLRWDGTLLLCGRTEIPPVSGQLRQDLQIPLPPEVQEAVPTDVNAMELYLAVLKERGRGRGNPEFPDDLCYNVLEPGTESVLLPKFIRD